MMLFRQSQTFWNYIFVSKESIAIPFVLLTEKQPRASHAKMSKKSWKQSFMPFYWSCCVFLHLISSLFWRAFSCRSSLKGIDSPKKLLVSWYNTCKMPLLILRAINSDLISSETMKSFSHFKLNRINCFFDSFVPSLRQNSTSLISLMISLKPFIQINSERSKSLRYTAASINFSFFLSRIWWL